ncbi:unnamed protein product [Adineta ricciae]|uniref:Uncharacterized protein n=1 Tax=Adineta ricciae TaxID=249248 RepID=A0A814NQM7_ADIRI|nr:unnamed protein product [Adineta ricciae]CAF1449316.1 unnamed protein product [Adineta ricciae]
MELIHNKTAQKEFIQISSIAREVASASNISQHSSPAEVHADNTMVTKPVSAATTDTSLEILRNHPSHPEYEREVLNMYGRYLTLNKNSNKFLIMTISVIVISSIIIAGIEGCFLASITVYPDGPCPIYGLMECFHGSNFTYFPCTPGNTINFTLYSNSATCFRWIARDASISNVVTQIGICTGLLTAFGSVVEVVIRLLLFVFQQRRCVATGIRRLLEKTVGINRITKPTRCCGMKLPFQFGILDLRLYQRPWLVVIFLILYTLLPLSVIGSIVLLSYFRISITSLTYIILLTIVLICCLALLWVIWEEDEIGRVIPGAWHDFKDIVSKHQLEKLVTVGQGVASGSDLKKMTDHTRNLLPKSQKTPQNSQVYKRLTVFNQEVR